MSDVAEHPLRGFTIGITADRRWNEQAALFERRGAAVLHGPSISTRPLDDDGLLKQATEAIIKAPASVLIANTGIGIRSWFAAAESWNIGSELIASLGAARIYARGPKASGAVHSAGLEVEARTSTERLADTVSAALDQLSPGHRVALQVDGSGVSTEEERLRAAGADVIVVPSYLWRSPDDDRPAVRLAEAVISGRVHAVTFTAAPAVSNWLDIADGHGIRGDLGRALTDGSTLVGSVGPVCTEALVSAGLGSAHLVQPAVSRLGPLVRAVAERLGGQRVHVEMSGASVVLSGALVTVDRREVQLTDTEARLFRVLAVQPDVVFAKDQLLRMAWPGAADHHAVEVTVARLRRKLGPEGQAIKSVHRRGYTIRTGGTPD